ncbi:hypothetical protein P175DRAFT_0521313 [Aspergillus ochraceoroseus IBT 24754]|uniref:Uncharacterized protein n=1 Tax=Aspergillus ochraceoroseus IBT 24754 TaxID=1392256 RepID=A0A2T5MAJ3_9EURO|nr:uncharacterized protein P175DRAFT_0521313 [Aspergillus ochraceoroseus IBT 24754]PTU25562.1 hypothetical protein P175DRAFT_0521313 [Aspergillus ochraceoroseus IBT 24754]
MLPESHALIIYILLNIVTYGNGIWSLPVLPGPNSSNLVATWRPGDLASRNLLPTPVSELANYSVGKASLSIESIPTSVAGRRIRDLNFKEQGGPTSAMSHLFL